MSVRSLPNFLGLLHLGERRGDLREAQHFVPSLLDIGECCRSLLATLPNLYQLRQETWQAMNYDSLPWCWGRWRRGKGGAVAACSLTNRCRRFWRIEKRPLPNLILEYDQHCPSTTALVVRELSQVWLTT